MNFFFRTTQELEYLFFCRAKREFFFQNLSLCYMTKTLNHIFFSSTKIRIFFSATLGIRIFFQKKTIPPLPFQVKWSFPYDVFFYVFLGKSMDRTFLSVGSPFIEEGGKNAIVPFYSCSQLLLPLFFFYLFCIFFSCICICLGMIIII